MSIEQAYDNALPELRAFLRQLGFNVNHSKLLGLIQHAFTLNTRTLTWLALAAGAYAVIEIIEAVGLWLLKRWGEYFAMIATSVGIPYEIYDLTAKVTVLRLVAFVINVALVVYLVVTKRLFGVRGGKKAYEARLRSASILQAEIDALAAGDGRTGRAGPQAAASARASAARPAGAGRGGPAMARRSPEVVTASVHRCSGRHCLGSAMACSTQIRCRGLRAAAPAGGVFGCGVLAWFLRWGADLAGEVTGQALIAGINLSVDIGMAAQQVFDAFGAHRGDIVHPAGPERVQPQQPARPVADGR